MAAEGFQPLEGVLPAVYARLLPALAASKAPIEAEATCSHCAMCAPADSTARGRKYFSPNSKCCTYHPTLPNYLVGALLADQQAEFEEGRRRIGAVIQHRAGVTPHGILPPKATSAVYDAVTPGLFGRAESLLCPYFNRGNGSCSIWQFREAVCSTFFCKFVHGGDGAEYWHGLKQVLIQAQTGLVQHALHQLGFAAHVILAGAEHDPTAEVLATIESAHGYRLSPNLLVRLHHFRILVSADSD